MKTMFRLGYFKGSVGRVLMNSWKMAAGDVLDEMLFDLINRVPYCIYLPISKCPNASNFTVFGDAKQWDLPAWS
jgi:hypothetical protein